MNGNLKHISGFFMLSLALISTSSDLHADPARKAITPRTQLPWREMHTDEVREILDSRIENQMRLELIRRATKTIEIVQYLQGNDKNVAMPVLSALRDAANRGVKVRFLTNFFTSIPFDPGFSVGPYLTDIPTVEPIQYLVFTPHREWGPYDYFHEKLLIIDGKWSITGGRAYGEGFVDWLDDGFITKGALVKDVSKIFERIWFMARAHERLYGVPQGEFEPKGGPLKPFKQYFSTTSMLLDPIQQAHAEAFYSWMQQEETGPSVRGRVIHFDYMQQRWLTGFPLKAADRLATLYDQILVAVMDRIVQPGTRDVYISAMSLMMHPSMKTTLIGAARRGVNVHLVTNSEKSNGLVAPLALNWVYSLPDMDEMLRAGVHIHVLKDMPEANAWKYLHKKMAIVDDTVFFGSHNFNLPTSLFNDEMDLEIEDPEFSRAARSSLEAQIERATTELHASDLSNGLKSGAVHSIEQWLAESLLPLF